MSELLQLIEKEIPEGRENLQENFNNLEKVAQFCQENYLQAADKKEALEQTKNYTTHSLASVAYQINNLATNFLKLLDLQQSQMAEMESNVNYLAETVQIHKEKVARCEIGVLTTQRTTTRPLGVKNGIIFPEHGERATKYQRKNIDYSTLDDIGHGVRGPETPGIMRSNTISAGQKSSRSSSISSTGTSPAPNQRPPTPPQVRQGGSLGRSSGQQHAPNSRTPAPAVAPPTVPSHYASMQQQQQMMREQQRTSAYAPGTPPTMGITSHPGQHTLGQMDLMPGPMAQMPGGLSMGQIPGGMGQIMQPPVGMARPISKTARGGSGGMSGQGMPVGRISQMQGLPEQPGGRISQMQGLPEQPGGRISQMQGLPEQPGGRISQMSHVLPEQPGSRISQMSHVLPEQPGGRISQIPKQTSIDTLPPPPMSPDEVGSDNKNMSFDEGSPPPPPPPQFDDDVDVQQQQEPYQDEDPYMAGPDIMSNDWVPEQYLEKVIAIYDYSANKEDELSFTENTVVYVVKKNDDDWWEGVLNGQTGLFPGNYVEPCM